MGCLAGSVYNAPIRRIALRPLLHSLLPSAFGQTRGFTIRAYSPSSRYTAK